MNRRALRVFAVLVIAAGSLTCGESSGPDPNAVARVVITPANGSLDTGDSLQFTAVARNSQGDAISGKTIAWSTLDGTLISVGATGMVRGRWPGVARLVATSDQHADTAVVQVAPKISRIEVTLPFDTIRSLIDPWRLSVHAFIGTEPYPGGSYTWSLSNPAVAHLYPYGLGGPSDSLQVIQSDANGTTYVRVVEARGARDSALVVVQQRVAFILASQFNSALRGCPIRIPALAVDAHNNTVPGVVLTWASTDTTLARVDSSGLVTTLAAGVDTIVISSGAVTRRVPLTIRVPPTPTFEASGAFGPVTTVGVGQYGLGFGDLGAATVVGGGRFRVVSSDTTILKPSPADTEAFLFSTTIKAGPVRLVGRAVGDVMLTPYFCDAAGASVPFRVTRAKLKLTGDPPATARTDDPPVTFGIRNQDSSGAFQFSAVPVTVRITTTDTNVIQTADSAYRHLPVGWDQTYMNVTFPDSGTARVVLIDSSGVFLPDSSSAVHVRYPPLYIFSYGASVGDTLHIGMRQRPFYDVYRARVGLDRFVAGAPLRVSASTNDSTLVRVGLDTMEIPVGESATTTGFDIAARDTRGTAIINAHARRHVDGQLALVVGRPAVQVRGPSPDAAIYPGDPGVGAVQIFAVDSATGSFGFPTESVTFTLTVSDTAVVSLDSPAVTVPGGDYASSLADITFKKPGTVTITATDPRVASYSYAPGTSAPFTVLAPYLVADSAFSLGIGQTFGFSVNVNGRLAPGDVVHLTHRNPAIAMLADTTMTGSGVVGATGVAAGVDTVIATAPGFVADTGTIVVGPGTIGLDYWPSVDLAVGQTWSPPITLSVFAPDGGVRVTAGTLSITLTANANIEFIKDGVPVTSVTVAAGEHGSEQFYLKGKAAGTGTVTFSAPNYAPLTKSVTVSP